jgi:hypothetical protein
MKPSPRKIKEPVPLKKEVLVQSSLDRFIIKRSTHNTPNNNGMRITRSRAAEAFAINKEHGNTQLQVITELCSKRRREPLPIETTLKAKVRLTDGPSPVFQDNTTQQTTHSTEEEEEHLTIKQEPIGKTDLILHAVSATTNRRRKKMRTGM